MTVKVWQATELVRFEGGVVVDRVQTHAYSSDPSLCFTQVVRYEDYAALLDALAALMRHPLLDLGDAIYQVRERAGEDGEWRGSSWDHPQVVAWGDAVTKAEAILKEAGR